MSYIFHDEKLDDIQRVTMLKRTHALTCSSSVAGSKPAQVKFENVKHFQDRCRFFIFLLCEDFSKRFYHRGIFLHDRFDAVEWFGSYRVTMLKRTHALACDSSVAGSNPAGVEMHPPITHRTLLTFNFFTQDEIPHHLPNNKSKTSSSSPKFYQ